jgi:methionyl-tRNA formyltransferase
MRIVFLSVDDEFAGGMQRHVYERHPEWVVASVVSTRDIYKRNKFSAVFFILMKSGFYYFLQMVRIKIWRKLFSREKMDTPVSLAKAHPTELFRCADINTNRSIEKIKTWRPDLIISTNFSHFLGKRVRAIAKYGTWNLHKSYLPYYRGMAPNFFALLESAPFVGATLHVVNDAFDAGPILIQVKLTVESKDTVYTLNQKSSEHGGAMLAEFLEEVDLQAIKATPQPAGPWKTDTYPNRKEIALFRRKGLLFDGLTSNQE